VCEAIDGQPAQPPCKGQHLKEPQWSKPIVGNATSSRAPGRYRDASRRVAVTLRGVWWAVRTKNAQQVFAVWTEPAVPAT